MCQKCGGLMVHASSGSVTVERPRCLNCGWAMGSPVPVIVVPPKIEAIRDGARAALLAV